MRSAPRLLTIRAGGVRFCRSAISNVGAGCDAGGEGAPIWIELVGAGLF
jgi:hypothetical protein